MPDAGGDAGTEGNGDAKPDQSSQGGSSGKGGAGGSSGSAGAGAAAGSGGSSTGGANSGGTGGTIGEGGTTSTGGTGGTIGEGGTTGTGGLGGTTGEGGTTGTGGLGGSAGDAGSAGTGGSAGTAGGVGNPSCTGLPANCGATHDANCCEAVLEPGGTFLRSYDSVTFTDSSNPATLNAFKLDVYEVTVGRFRNFLAGYPGNLPSSGAGKNPNNLSDAGWNSAWNASMPQSPNELSSKLKCPSQSTWTDTVDIHENFPIDCVTWYEAFAFCIWDGGRLPTEAEWNYVAAGGGDANGQRVYPWSNPSTATTIGEAFAVFCGTTCKPQEVGSRSPQGDARWGHADMSGNVWEWVVDGYSDLYINPCPDCIGARGQTRAVRGGGFGDDAPALHVAWRNDNLPDNRTDDYGIRCARSP